MPWNDTVIMELLGSFIGGRITQHNILKPCLEKGKRETKSFGWTVTQEDTEFKVNQLNFSTTVPIPVYFLKLQQTSHC